MKTIRSIGIGILLAFAGGGVLAAYDAAVTSESMALMRNVDEQMLHLEKENKSKRETVRVMEQEIAKLEQEISENSALWGLRNCDKHIYAKQFGHEYLEQIISECLGK